MGTVTLDLPIVGQPNTTEDIKVRNNFTTLQNTINGNLDGSNLSPTILSQLGNFKNALQSVQVQDLGNVSQIRAGRVLTPADFTNMGLSAPRGLWNLSNINDSSGNGRNLVNKGSVTFDTGITGSSSEAALFTGSTAQALYIVDTGAADPFRISSGSWGCWCRTAKRGTAQNLITKVSSAAGNFAWSLSISNTTNAISGWISLDGTALSTITGSTDIADDRWHFVVMTYDGTRVRGYTDGVLDSSQVVASGTIFPGNGPLNIGAQSADAGTVSGFPSFGRVDEAFVTADVLSPEQIYNLYCASIPHTLGVVPTGTRLGVRRRRRGGPLTTSNFPVAGNVSRLYNFTNQSTSDEGTNAVALTPGAIYFASGADGTLNGARGFTASSAGDSATDAGLPSGTSARSYGCWFKTTNAPAGGQGIIGWGTISTADTRIYTTTILGFNNGADGVTGPFVSDGLWHYVVGVEDNSAIDLVKRKLYLDGRLIGGSTTLNSITLAGANRFRIGAAPDGTIPFTGQIDGVFVYAGALTPEQVKTLYNVGSQQLALAPKSDADHIEALELTRVLAHFDTLEGSDMVDLAVVA